MTHLIRSACLTRYPEVAASVGLKPIPMLRSVRLPLDSLRDPDIRISVDAFCRLLEASAEASETEDFGLRLAHLSGLTNLGPVALVVREQPTLGVAMETLARYVHIHTEAVRLRIERYDNLAIFAPVLLQQT